MNATMIGKYFFSKNNNLTDIQIQKLTYYAYAWYMVKNDGAKIFEESPEAWVHGPVFRSLYDNMKKNKFYEESDEIGIENEKSFLDIIYKIYGKYSGNELETMTHSEQPWKAARARAGLMLSPMSRSAEKIKDEDILAWGKANT
ncbi:putative uncharacterized protein [Clostridium sp. CAG:793]|nr:putative uncharacterized protein [Clostridium sp. CAG:793]